MIARLVCAGLAAGLSLASSAAPADETPVERGKYLITIAGCNDCHTPGYIMTDGATPQSEWLTGDSLGWRGPWGTTYPPNLRLLINDLTEAEWIEYARTLRTRPPMPWFNLNQMKEEDLKAIYAFVNHLGPAGGEAPRYVPPDQEPEGPYATFPAPPQ